MTSIVEDRFQGLDRITVENEAVAFSVLPQVGGKMISLRCKGTGREHLSLSGRPFQAPAYDGKYEDYDISGFDECFPSIAPGFYPEAPWRGVAIPDHGEVWCLPWEREISGESLTLTVHGVRFPYRFAREFELRGNRVRISYRLRNFSPFDLKYVWAAHPLLSAKPGTRIVLPGPCPIRTDWSRHERLGRLLYETTWPNARGPDGQAIDLSVVERHEAGQATKFFASDLSDGFCALHDPETGDFIRFDFALEDVPHVGVWLNEGGWPLDGTPSFNVALEPGFGCPDKLATAIQRGENACVAGGAEKAWALEITVGRSSEEISA